MNTAADLPGDWAVKRGVKSLYEDFLAALLQGARNDALKVAREAARDGVAIESIYLGVFQPALQRIGELWASNELTVAGEHLATSITQGTMAALYGEFFPREAADGPRLVAACPESERHAIGLHMICDLLELHGWDTTYLGAGVPMKRLIAELRAREPQVLALSTALTTHVDSLQAVIEEVREEFGEKAPQIMVGGRPFVRDPALAARIGADLSAEDAGEAVTMLRRRFP